LYSKRIISWTTRARAGRQRSRLEVRGKSLDLDGFLGVLDAQDDHGLAEEGLAMVGLEALGGELAAIIDTDNVGILGREIDLVFGPGAERALAVGDFGSDKDRMLALIVGGKADLLGATCRADRLGTHLAALLASHDTHLARLKLHAPHHMILVVVLLAPHALAAPVDEEFHLVGLVVVAPQVDGLAGQPVPVGEEVEDRLVRPLALVHIINVLRESGQVDDAKIATSRRIAIRGGLADIVPSCPNKLSGTVGSVLHNFPGLLMGRGPRGVGVVIGRAHHRGVGIGQVPALRQHEDAIRGHAVVAARLQGGDALGEEEGLTGEVLGHVLHPLMVVVETDEVDGARLEEVVIRGRFVTARRDGTRGVVALDDVSEVDREERVGRKVVAMGERRSVVARVEDEVGLLQRQFIGVGSGPLFQYLVANAPDEDAGVVAVTKHQV